MSDAAKDTACPFCGAALPPDVAECPSCGKPTAPVEDAAEVEDAVTAAPAPGPKRRRDDEDEAVTPRRGSRARRREEEDDEDEDERPRRRSIVKEETTAATDFLVPTNVSGWAMASCYLGFVGCFVPVLGLLLCLPALVFGIIALTRPQRGASYNAVTSNIRAVIGLIFGGIGTLLWLGVLVAVLLRK